MAEHIPAWIAYNSLPGAIILASLLLDLASSISQPKIVRAVFRWLSSPFRNFLTLEDLSEPVDLTPRCPKVKNRFLVGLASILFICWTGWLVFRLYIDDHVYAVKLTVQSVSWVSPLYVRNYLVTDLSGRVLVLYRSKIDLQTFFDAAISFYRLCAEFSSGFFCGFRTRRLECQRKKCRCRRPCYDYTRNFRMARGHVAFKALPALSKCCATK